MTLEQFVDWWLEHRTFKPPAESPINVNGSLHGVVLYRDAPFQVQLFIVAPGSEIPDHVHPNVDSYEIYLSGQIAFRRRGKRITTPHHWRLGDALFGHRIEVRSTDAHGASFGPLGGSFLSVQQWLNGVPPSSVGDDWEYASRDQVSKSYVKGKT